MEKKKSKKIDITIVGAGHYGRELITPLYKKNKRCSLKAVISPTIEKEVLKGSELEYLPLFRNIIEWRETMGESTISDLFDLSVHPHLLPGLVEELAAIGAKNFVFPKPVARNGEDLKKLSALKRQYGLCIVVASQWHYSEVTTKLKELIEKISKESVITKIYFDWSQSMSRRQLNIYTPASALLPHMLQIIHSIGLLSPHVAVTLRSHSGHHLNVELFSGRIIIELFTNLQTPEKKRLVEIFVQGREVPEVVGDFLGVFKDGQAFKYPAIFYKGGKEEIHEDNLAIMTDKILQAFSDDTLEKDSSILTFNRYMRVAQTQIQIEEALHG